MKAMRRQGGRWAVLSAAVAASFAAIGAARVPAPAPPLAPPPAPAPAPPVNPWAEAVPPNLEAHIAAATKAAGVDLWGILQLCLPIGFEAPVDNTAPPMK